VDGRLVARYQSAASPMKPYVRELFSPPACRSPSIRPGSLPSSRTDVCDRRGRNGFLSEKPLGKFGSQSPRTNSTEIIAGGVKQILDWIARMGGCDWLNRAM